MVPLNMSRCLANVGHPAVILLWISLYCLCFVSGAVALSKVDVAFNVLDRSVVDIYWCVGLHHHLCLRLVHLHSLIFTLSIHAAVVVVHVVL